MAVTARRRPGPPPVSSLVCQAGDQVVQVGQQLLGRQVQVGEGPDGGTQPAHGGRGVDAVADHVADDQGDPRPGQRDHVEPVAADPAQRVGGQVAGGHLHRGPARAARAAAGCAAARGPRALPGVAAGVVEAHRGAGDELLGQPQVVLRRRGPAGGAGRTWRPQRDAAGPHRHDHRRRAAEVAEGGGPAPGSSVAHARGQRVQPLLDQDRAAGQTAGDRGSAGAGRRPPRRARRTASGQPSFGPTAWPARRSGPGAVRQRPGTGSSPLSTDSSRSTVTKSASARHGDVGQLLGGPHDVQGAADARAGLVQQGEAFLGPVALGDVDDRVVHADRVAVVVVEPGERHRVGRVPVRRRADRTDVLVADDGLAGLQDLAHHRLQGLGVQARLDVREPLPDPLVRGSAAELLQGRVRPHVPQVRVHDGYADGRVRGHPLQHRAAHVPARGAGRVGGQDHPARRALRGLHGRDDPHRRDDGLPVAVAHRQEPGPAAVAAAAAGQVGQPRGVLGHQQLGHGPADDLGPAIAEQPLGVAGPAGHRHARVQQHHRGVRHVEPPPRHAALLARRHSGPLRPGEWSVPVRHAPCTRADTGPTYRRGRLPTPAAAPDQGRTSSWKSNV